MGVYDFGCLPDALSPKQGCLVPCPSTLSSSIFHLLQCLLWRAWPLKHTEPSELAYSQARVVDVSVWSVASKQDMLLRESTGQATAKWCSSIPGRQYKAMKYRNDQTEWNYQFEVEKLCTAASVCLFWPVIPKLVVRLVNYISLGSTANVVRDEERLVCPLYVKNLAAKNIKQNKLNNAWRHDMPLLSLCLKDPSCYYLKEKKCFQ